MAMMIVARVVVAIKAPLRLALSFDLLLFSYCIMARGDANDGLSVGAEVGNALGNPLGLPEAKGLPVGIPEGALKDGWFVGAPVGLPKDDGSEVG